MAFAGTTLNRFWPLLRGVFGGSGLEPIIKCYSAHRGTPYIEFSQGTHRKEPSLGQRLGYLHISESPGENTPGYPDLPWICNIQYEGRPTGQATGKNGSTGSKCRRRGTQTAQEVWRTRESKGFGNGEKCFFVSCCSHQRCLGQKACGIVLCGVLRLPLWG